ncbi:MAG: 4'-phosphopantetheinyl transferase superfamily protein [Wenzhouxiangella sp.]|nr:4'-phosphopantetheinyl transferase superfamily protein [Wenzhouxiangella sp.]
MSECQRVPFPIPSQPRPERHTVDVWLVDLSAMPMPVAQGDSNPPGGSLHNPARDRRIRQRFFVRLLLARYLDQPGKDIQLAKDSNGKPHIVGESLAINWSHTRDWLAVAVGHRDPIGIDIELSRTLARVGRLARRCYPSEEAHAIAALDEPACSKAFLQRWTKTEALVKAQGERLASALGSIRFSHPNQTLMHCPKHWVAPVNWSIQSLEFDAPLIAALASPEPILSVRLNQVQWPQ